MSNAFLFSIQDVRLDINGFEHVQYFFSGFKALHFLTCLTSLTLDRSFAIDEADLVPSQTIHRSQESTSSNDVLCDRTDISSVAEIS